MNAGSQIEANSGKTWIRRVSSAVFKTAHTLGEIIYGATVYEMVRDLKKERAQINHLFVLVTFGDFLGVPILPPYYTLRLLPFMLKDMPGWKRSLLREKDLTDLCDQEIT
jgi:hypothetical protein